MMAIWEGARGAQRSFQKQKMSRGCEEGSKKVQEKNKEQENWNI